MAHRDLPHFQSGGRLIAGGSLGGFPYRGRGVLRICRITEGPVAGDEAMGLHHPLSGEDNAVGKPSYIFLIHSIPHQIFIGIGWVGGSRVIETIRKGIGLVDDVNW